MREKSGNLTAASSSREAGLARMALAKFDLDPEVNGFYYRDEVMNFGVKLSSRPAYEVPEHAHDNIQVSVPVGDTFVEVQWRTQDGQLHRSVALRGHAMIIPPGQRHAVAWNNRAVFVNLHIGTVLPRDEMGLLLAAVAKVGETHVVNDPFLSAFGENILSLVSHGVGFDESLMRALRLMVVAHIINAYAPDHALVEELGRDGIKRSATTTPSETVTGDAATDQEEDAVAAREAGSGNTKELARWQLRKVVAEVESDLRRDHSVAELAALVNLSKGHFSRAFRASTGLSPRQWIIQKRIKLAIGKLAHTSDSLAEISANCGFAEQSHFTRTFTQATGTSPGAWRRANKV